MPDTHGPAALISARQQLDEQARAFIASSTAPATRRAYAADWAHFERWCAAHDEPALPATAATIARYLTALAATHKVATIRRRLTSIAVAHRYAGHEPATATAAVRQTLQGIRRARAREGVVQKEAAVTAIIRRMLAALPETAGGTHDRALLLLGFAGAFRRSELVSLDVADLQFTREGLVVTLRSSKTDQAGAGELKGIPYGSNPDTCPVRALQAWIALARLSEGALFHPIDRHGNIKPNRLSPQGVARIVKAAAAAAGLDPAKFSGHSLRAGLATAAAEAGVDERAIMEQTGHHSVQVARRYIRRGSLFRNNAAAQVGL